MIASFLARRRATARWTPPRRFDRNLIVIGAGSAGLVSAAIAASARAKVTLVEARAMGGGCRNAGCVPSKTLIRSARLAQQVREAGEFGIDVAAPVIAFDDRIAATGRKARPTGVGLEALGIETNRVVTTNGFQETSLPHILAAGDVAGLWQVTHTAGTQGAIAATNAMLGGLWRVRMDDRAIPWATFCDPDVARVGLSEEEALPHEVTRYDLAELDRALADDATRVFVKGLTVPGRDRILGVTIVGAEAGDLIAEFVLAMKHRLGLGKILSTIHIYPTMAEANRGAAGAWRRAHLNPRLPALAARWHDRRRR